MAGVGIGSAYDEVSNSISSYAAEVDYVNAVAGASRMVSSYPG